MGLRLYCIIQLLNQNLQIGTCPHVLSELWATERGTLVSKHVYYIKRYVYIAGIGSDPWTVQFIRRGYVTS